MGLLLNWIGDLLIKDLEKAKVLHAFCEGACVATLNSLKGHGN